MPETELKVGQVRYYAPLGEFSDDWRVIQAIEPEGYVYGGYVEQTPNGLYYVQYLTYSSWGPKLIGDLIMTLSDAELEAAVALGRSLAGK